jgi:hypothetical protein
MEFISVVLAGVSIFVVGQLILKLFIEPIQQFKKTMAEVTHTSVRYSHAIHNPHLVTSELQAETYDKLRQLSGQLCADMELIPVFPYPFLRWLFSLPTRAKVYESVRHLIATGNWMRSPSDKKFDYTVRSIQAACDSLGLYTDPADRVPEEHLRK